MLTKKRRRPPVNVRKDCKDGYFNYYLREARINCELTVLKLSERTGINSRLIYAYGRLRCFPPQKNARKIARVLGVRVEDIFPETIRELTLDVERERKKKQRIICLGSN
tara:strand:- start:1339 stop:1665 length:327 start_codon:yes stop_codon:yes gene_type:complete